ncbi:MAG: ankyrin repeat domain-containing protein [Campylobacterota bacterium]|nr:ankyrin repeat domain-containing protein [Campylobacterota bacterium]
MLSNFFKKKFTNENFILELSQLEPKYEWLEEALSSNEIDINHKDEFENTVLMNCLKKNKFKAAIWLLKYHADPSIKNNDNKDATDIAIEKNKLIVVEELLKLKKLDKDQRDKYGRSLLQNVTVFGNHDMAKLLIDYGADINNLDNKGKHIMYDALSFGDLEFVQYLLTFKNIELNDIDKDGNTLMQHPQIVQNDSLAKNLLMAGSDPTIKDKKGESFLFNTAMRGTKDALDVVKVALVNGADVNQLTSSNNTIMMDLVLEASKLENNPQTIRSSIITIVEEMLKYNGDINALDNKGESGLFNAIALRDMELIDFLLEHEIDVNIQNKKGQTVLEYLVYDGMEYSKLISKLLDYGINPRLKNKDGQTIYEILTNIILHNDEHIPIEDEHLVSLIDPDGLYINVVQLILKSEVVEEGKEYILEFFDSKGDPLFFKPLMYDNFSLFNLYTKFPINLHMLNKQKHNIFFSYVLRTFENDIATASVVKNFKDNISSLISRKVDKDFKDSLGWTILHKVVSTNCNIKLFDVLISVVRFDFTITDNLGRTVIHNAVWHDKLEVIRTVSKVNQNLINVEDIYGIAPVFYAAILGNKNLVLLFLDSGANLFSSTKIDPKAIKKFAPMLKNLPKLLEKEKDKSHIQKFNSVIAQVVTKFKGK